MELAEAIKRRLPLQVLLPDRSHPMRLQSHATAEMFLAETAHGPVVIWVDLGWCDVPAESGLLGATAAVEGAATAATPRVAANGPGAVAACHIAYAYPRFQAAAERWVDEDPMYGPHCIPWQKPVIIERLLPQSPRWNDYQAWQSRRFAAGLGCARPAAWQQVERVYGRLIHRRVV
jgi:hypothetical protein